MGVRVIDAVNAGYRQGDRKEEPLGKLRVAAYCRVSTDSEEQETSYEAQCSHYRSFIRANPAWEMAGIYADEGISGTLAKKRPQFLEMIEACRGRRIDMVITKSISRFSRNTVDCLHYIRLLKEMEIPVLFEKEGINTMDSAGEVLLTILASISQQESKSISDNVRMGIQYNFQQGKGMLNTAYFLGYERGERPHTLVIDPRQAALVRRIYREFLEGFTPAMIAGRLCADHIPTVTGREVWHASTITSILSNEKYCGDLLMQKYYTADFLTHRMVPNRGKRPQYYVENDHDPIIPREIFHQVQGEMKRRQMLAAEAGRSRGSGAAALSGRVFCGRCGQAFRRYVRKDAWLTDWRCAGRALVRMDDAKEKRCGCRIVKESALHEAVKEAFDRLRTERDALLLARERARCALVQMDDAWLEAQQKRQAAPEERPAAPEERPAALGEGQTASDAHIRSLSLQRAEAADREMQAAMLLELVEQMLCKGSRVWRMMLAGREQPVPEGPACRDREDFFRMTGYHVPAQLLDRGGRLTRFDDDLVIRFLDRITVLEDGVAVRFKAGISFTVAGAS